MIAGLTLLAAAVPVVAPDIVVTGRALPATRGDGAFAVATITPDRIQASASGRIEDVLRDVAGIQQFRRSDARSANPTSQGITLRGLGGNAAARTLVLLDGVPQGDPFGGYISWPLFAPDRIGGVRVTRGGGSGVSGPGALAGTIEFDSVAADARTTVRASLANARTVALGAVVAGRLGRGFALIAGNLARGDGFVPVVAAQRGTVDIAAPYAQGSLVLRGVIPAGSGELQANLALFDDRRARGTAFSANRTTGSDASLRFVRAGGPLPISVLAYVQLRRFATQSAAIDAARGAAMLVLDQFEVPALGIGGRVEVRPQMGRMTLRIGGDARHVDGRTQERFNYVGGTATRLRDAGGTADTVGGFADASVPMGAVLLTGGLRIDAWRLAAGHLRETVVGNGTVTQDRRYQQRRGAQATGRLGLAWTPMAGIGVRAAVYRGWRLPTLNELYRSFRVGADATSANAQLAPERSRGAEIGVDLTVGTHISVSATAFAARIDDAIANVTVGTGPAVFPDIGFVAGVYRRRTNIAAVTTRGIEVDARARLANWQLSASLAHADSRLHGAAPGGLRPAGVAPLQASATLGWRAVAATLRYVSAQYDDDANARRLRPALTIDAVAGVSISDRLTAMLRVENLTDTVVEAGASATGVVERATPRLMWIGLRYRQ